MRLTVFSILSATLASVARQSRQIGRSPAGSTSIVASRAFQGSVKNDGKAAWDQITPALIQILITSLALEDVIS